MTTQNVEDVGRRWWLLPSLREGAARGDTPFRTAAPPSSGVGSLTLGEGVSGLAPAIRHRWGTGDICVDCGADFATFIGECRGPACESCRTHAAVVTEYGFRLCLDCRNGGRP